MKIWLKQKELDFCHAFVVVAAWRKMKTTWNVFTQYVFLFLSKCCFPVERLGDYHWYPLSVNRILFEIAEIYTMPLILKVTLQYKILKFFALQFLKMRIFVQFCDQYQHFG